MDNLIRKFNSQFFLRSGLGLMFLTIGYKTINNPSIRQELVSALNSLLSQYKLIQLDAKFLLILGIFEVVIGVLFLAWFLPKRTVFWAGLGGAVEVLIILILLGISAKTFLYIGVLGALISVTLAYRRGRY